MNQFKHTLYIYLVLSLLIVLSMTAEGRQKDNGLNRKALADLIVKESVRQGLEPALALAVAKVESDFTPDALSKAGARGVMQIMPQTAKNLYDIAPYRLYDPVTNIRAGTQFLRHLLNIYDGRIEIALSHYNGGSRVRGKNGQLSIIPATKGYVKKVLKYRQQYRHHPRIIALANGASLNREHHHDETLPMLGRSVKSRVEQLQALRLHNLTRNGKKTVEKGTQSHSKMLIVKSWESVYPNSSR